jgi:CO dehydrogenase nickel-insertion accessory protein CooC1
VPAPVPLLDRRLVFVTGKGGVGKTTVASALGVLAANQGKRTLVCEVDAKGNLDNFFGGEQLTFTPRQVAKNLHTCGCSSGCRCSPAWGRSPAPSTSWPRPRPA